jgi:hypothetical protein
MRLLTRIGQVGLGWVALMVAQIVAGMVVPISMPTGSQQSLGWLAASDLLVVAALGLAAGRSDWKGWKLGTVLAAIPLGIAAINFIEGAVFLTRLGINWPRIAAETFLTYALATPLWVLVLGRAEGSERDEGHGSWRPFYSQSTAQKVWKFVASDAIYVVLYLTAGTIIFPLVKTFYATQAVPPMGKIVALQLLLRGPLFVGICLLLFRMVRMSRWSGGVAVGSVFAIVSGVAPLLIPNPFFPDSVRWVHLCEVTSSNFLFGVLVSWIWGAPEIALDLARQAA